MRVKTLITDNCGVICDLCGADFTNSSAEGGMVFVSTGVCPACVPRFMTRIKKNKEQKYITAQADPGETFRDFIHRFRGGDNSAFIITNEILKVSPSDIGRRVVQHGLTPHKEVIRRGKIVSTRTPFGALKPDHIGIRFDDDPEHINYEALAYLEFEDAWENSP